MRLTVNQVSSEYGGSNPSLPTDLWPVRLEEGRLVFNQERGDRYPYGLQLGVYQWRIALDVL